MDPVNFYMIYKLAEMGALNSPIKTSTTSLSRVLKTSQQTVSRWLIKLEREGFISRNILSGGQGEYILLREPARKILVKAYLSLKVAFEDIKLDRGFEFIGKVFTGLMEGGYYVSRKGYLKQFVQKLGFKPYPGTLNLKLVTPPSRIFLEYYAPIYIEGFKTSKRTYGPARCYPAIIEDLIKGAVIVAERTHYDHTVIELLAPVNLRKELSLKDGDKVKVKILARPKYSE